MLMDPVVRVSLATLALLSLLGALGAALRPAAERRLERTGLVLHHGVALGVAIAAAMGSMIGGGDGRPLLLCAAGPLLVLALQDVATPRLAVWSVPLVVVGLVAQALVLTGVAPAAWAGALSAALAFSACVAGVLVSGWRARQEVTPRARALRWSLAITLGAGALASLLALLPADLGRGLWAVALGAAGALGTAARVRPQAPPSVADVTGALVLGGVVLVACAAVPLDVGHSALVATWVSLTALGCAVVVRASLSVAADARPPAPAASSSTALPSAQALALMAPLLDDALLRRPARPRVVARVPARRVLEAALERARTAQPAGRGRRDEPWRIDVVVPDADLDLDGDPADLADALCAVLDNAMRMRARQPETQIQVHIRATPGAVTFEVSDSLPAGVEASAEAALPDPDAPFMNPRGHDADRPGLGVSLARARLLVERNGGVLSTHFTAEGSTVEVTMPRRVSRGAVGLA